LSYDYALRPTFQPLDPGGELSNILGCEEALATPDSLHKELREDILEDAVHAA
jgi:predicted nucleotidyltransferase